MHNFTMVATGCLHGEALRTSAQWHDTIGIFEAALISLLAEACGIDIIILLMILMV